MNMMKTAAFVCVSVNRKKSSSDVISWSKILLYPDSDILGLFNSRLKLIVPGLKYLKLIVPTQIFTVPTIRYYLSTYCRIRSAAYLLTDFSIVRLWVKLTRP